MDAQRYAPGEECTTPSQARVAIGLGLPEAARQPWPPTEKRTITITQGLSGYAVNVGCQWVAFETKEKVVSELLRYLNDPTGVEKEYLEKAKK